MRAASAYPNSIHWIARFCLCFACMLSSSTVVAADSKDINVNDVYIQAEIIRKEIELLRREMGQKPEAEQSLPILGITLQEVWFQALTLYRRSDQLAFELTRNRFDAPPLPRGEIIPTDVMKVLNATLKRIREIKVELHINEVVSVEEPDAQRFPTDLFNIITQANRQLSVLTERRVSSSDVYQQLTLAIQYASMLLSEYDDVLVRVPSAPEYQRYKEPIDVFERLLQCLSITRNIYHNLGLSSLAINPTAVSAMEVQTADVYDVAVVLVAQLDFLVRRREYTVELKSFYPGRKIQADSFQRVGILEQQLRLLSEKSGRRDG